MPNRDSELQDLELPQQGGRPVTGKDSNPALYDLGLSWERCSLLTWQEDVGLDEAHSHPCGLGCSDPETLS